MWKRTTSPGIRTELRRPPLVTLGIMPERESEDKTTAVNKSIIQASHEGYGDMNRKTKGKEPLNDYLRLIIKMRENSLPRANNMR